LLTFALNDVQSFQNIDCWKKEFLQYSRTTDVNFPFLVVATKVFEKIKKFVALSIYFIIVVLGRFKR